MNATTPDDSRILSLFREWVVVERVAGVLAEDEKCDESDEYAEAIHRTIELVAAISDSPAAGAAGLAIKSYLAVHTEDVTLRDDMAALSGEALVDHAFLTRSILEDAVRFVPELAPFAAAVLARQPDDQPEEDDAEPEGIGFGEPDERP